MTWLNYGFQTTVPDESGTCGLINYYFPGVQAEEVRGGKEEERSLGNFRTVCSDKQTMLCSAI